MCLNTKYALLRSESGLGRNEGDLRKGTTAESWERMGFTDSKGRRYYSQRRKQSEGKGGGTHGIRRVSLRQGQGERREDSCKQRGELD